MLRDAAGLELHVEQWGPSDGSPRALLLHGLTSSAVIWWQIGEALADRGWSVTAPDLRGHGRSPRASSYRLDELRDDVLALGSGWDLVVGHSLGGALTVLALSKDPSFAHRAVLIDPALQTDPEGVEAFLGATLTLVASADVDAYQAEHPAWHRRAVETWVESHRAVDPEAVTAILRENQPWQITETARELSLPVHVIAADPQLNAAFTAAEGEFLQATNPNWTWEIVIGASHSVHRDVPDLVIDRLLG
jgi:pimeloyl-ACP methyl ester carboxylesterase